MKKIREIKNIKRNKTKIVYRTWAWCCIAETFLYRQYIRVLLSGSVFLCALCNRQASTVKTENEELLLADCCCILLQIKQTAFDENSSDKDPGLFSLCEYLPVYIFVWLWHILYTYWMCTNSFFLLYFFNLAQILSAQLYLNRVICV